MITCNEVREYLNLPRVDRDFLIDRVDSLGVNKNTLMFINKPDVNLYYLDNSKDCIFLVDKDLEFLSERNDFISVDNPKYVFCKLVEKFKWKSRLQLEYRSPYWSDRFDYCREVYVGSQVSIDPGAIIGGTDFSPVMTNNPGELIQFPQMGGVRIGNNVVIKYNSMIGKGTFEYTEIGDYTMIDYGCQVGHNCKVGRACIIAAGTIIGGSTTIGDNVVIGIGARIRNGLHIGNNVSIGMGSVVVKDIPDNCVVVGNPARIIEHKHIFSKEGLK